MRQTPVHRLAALEAYEPERAWEHTRGISSLLHYARTLPRRGAWEMPDLDPDAPGLGGLLARARLALEVEKEA